MALSGLSIFTESCAVSPTVVLFLIVIASEYSRLTLRASKTSDGLLVSEARGVRWLYSQAMIVAKH
jgi:hypothetical protein